MILYALHDSNAELKDKFGAFVISKEKAVEYNTQGYGIFFTPNVFNGARKTENLVEIKYWFADMDKNTKPEQMVKINKLLLKPSIIVESKRGYHLYWACTDATVGSFTLIMEGISKKLEADEVVKGCNRMMRMTGYYHMKDMQNPYMVNIIEKNDEKYTEKEMLYAFSFKKPVKKFTHSFNVVDNKDEMLDPDNWNKIFWLDQIKNGCRNAEFTRITFWLKDQGFDSSTIRSTIHEMNRRIYEPLEEKEIEYILRSKI